MQGKTLEHPAQVIKETMPLCPEGRLLHKATLPRLGDIADLTNTKKIAQKDRQNGETKKHALNETTIKNIEKELNKMKIRILPDKS